MESAKWSENEAPAAIGAAASAKKSDANSFIMVQM